MKAIETLYKGYRFRSRLEARWAVFFDAMGVPWEYEVEGFELGSGDCYLPDFRIQRARTLFHCRKKDLDGRVDSRPDLRYAMPPGNLVDLDEYILVDVPVLRTIWLEVKPAVPIKDSDSRRWTAFIRGLPEDQFLVCTRGDPYDMDLLGAAYHPETQLSMGRIGFVGRSHHGELLVVQQGAGSQGEVFDAFLREIILPSTVEAMVAARSARFEHGETPGVRR